MSRLLIAALALLLIVGCGGADRGGDTPAAVTAISEDTGGEEKSPCQPTDAPKPKDVELEKPAQKLDAGKSYVARVQTNCGDFEITLDPERAPRTDSSFKALVDEGVYDGLAIHRIAAWFVIQGGDPAGDGSGGPGYSIVEKPRSDLKYEPGVVAMAKTQTDKPGTSGSRFLSS